MSNPNVNLKQIDYDSIKSEIVSYISSRSEFQDFNFEGSALATVIDLLSFNTFYQVLFQNILVNEMFLDSAQKIESVISHAKLHGYTVPGPNSSKATLKITNTGSVGDSFPAYTTFEGKKSNGSITTFYNVTPVVLTENAGSVEAVFDVYEANQLVENAIFENTTTTTNINIAKQSVFIPEIDLDTRTLKVEVKLTNEAGDQFIEYTLSSSVLPNTSTNDKFYYLERRDSGYNLVFGSFIDQITGEVSGNQLTDDSKVRITYLVSSGSNGNGYSSFSFLTKPQNFETAIITNMSGLSTGGQNQPNIEALKFYIPRSFAAQERVVTKEDIKVLLVTANLTDSLNNVIVKTNDEDSEIPLGTVKFKINGNVTETTIETALELVTEKGIASIKYEYDSGI